MAEETTFKGKQELPLSEENGVLKPPPRRKKSMKKSKMDAEKARQNVGTLSGNSENDSTVVIKDKDQASMSIAEEATEGSVSSKTTNSYKEAPPDQNTSPNDTECEISSSTEPLCTNDNLIINGSKANEQSEISTENNTKSDASLSKNENRKLHLEDDHKLCDHDEMAMGNTNKIGSARPTLEHTAITSNQSDICASQRQGSNDDEDVSIIVNDIGESFCWVDDNRSESDVHGEISKQTGPGPKDSNNYSTEAKSTIDLNESRESSSEIPSYFESSRTNVDLKSDNGIVGGDVQGSEMDIESATLSSISKEAMNDSSICTGSNIEGNNEMHDTINVSVKEESSLTALEDKVSSSSSQTECENNYVITFSVCQKTVQEKSNTPESDLGISEGTMENTQDDIVDSASKAGDEAEQDTNINTKALYQENTNGDIVDSTTCSKSDEETEQDTNINTKALYQENTNGGIVDSSSKSDEETEQDTNINTKALYQENTKGKKPASESSVPYQNLGISLSSGDECERWEDDNLSSGTDSDIFYSDFTNSEGEEEYNMEEAERLWGVQFDDDQGNSLTRSLSSGDPINEILSVFPKTEYLCVTDDNNSNYGSHHGDDNLGDGNHGDETHLELSEDRANSLKRKIGSFKVARQVDHMVNKDVVKEAAVAMAMDAYKADTSVSNNAADEAEKAIQALHKQYMRYVHRDIKSKCKASAEREDEGAAYFTRAPMVRQDSRTSKMDNKLEISRPRSIHGEPRMRSLSTGDIRNLYKSQNGNEGKRHMRVKSWKDENNQRLTYLDGDLRWIIGSLSRLEDSRERRDSGSPLIKHAPGKQQGLAMVAEAGAAKSDTSNSTKDIAEPCVVEDDVFEDTLTSNVELLIEENAAKDVKTDDSHPMVVQDENNTDLNSGIVVRPLSILNEEGAPVSSCESSFSLECRTQEDAIKNVEGSEAMLPDDGLKSIEPVHESTAKRAQEDVIQNVEENVEKNDATDGATPTSNDEAMLPDDGLKSIEPVHESTAKRPQSLEIQGEAQISKSADITESASIETPPSKADISGSDEVISTPSPPKMSGSTKSTSNNSSSKKNGSGGEVKLRKIKMTKGRRPFSAVEQGNIPRSPTEIKVQLKSFHSHIDDDSLDSGVPADIKRKVSFDIEAAEETVEETSPKRPPRMKGKLDYSASFATPSRDKPFKRTKNTKYRAERSSRWQTLSDTDWRKVSRLSMARSALEFMHDGPVTLVTDALPASIPNFPTHKRAQIALELFTTERTYVRGLETVIELFKTPLEGYLESKEIETMFSNINGIFLLNKDVLFSLCERVTHWKDEQMLGDIFVDMAPRFKIYATYCTNYDGAENLIKQKIKRKKDFEAFLNACYNDPICQPGLTLQAYLITVVQRIPRYMLLLRDLVKCTPAHHPDTKSIKEGLQKMNNIAEFINNQLQAVQGQRAMAELRSRVIGIKAFETPGRSLIKEGEVYLMSTKKTYKCLLFNDMIVFAAKNVNKHSEVELTLELKTLWVCDLNSDDPQTSKEDAIELYTPERSYTMYAGSRNEKKHWLQKLKTAIAIQLHGEEATDSSEISSRKAAFTFKDSRIYCGLFVDSKTQGHGVLAWPNRTRYVGNFEDGERNGIGELTYNTGEKYKGEWMDDKQHGVGTLTYPNGDVYVGEWQEGKMHGKGLIKFSNNDKLDGEFVDSEVCGWARLECTNTLFYEGTWKHSKKHGKGKLIKPNGDTYEGEFQNDRIHGQGEMVYAKTKATYNGQWENNQRHGIGTYSIPNGARYEGEWSSDHIQGRGKMVYGNGEVYEGSWFRNMRFGKGVFHSHEGVYDGHFEYNLRHKFGLQHYEDGSEYEGEWQNDQREGQGKMIYADTGIYEGSWFHNLRHARGKMIFPNGATYEGNWDLDSPHGSEGVYVDQASDYIYEGDWVHGRKEGRGVEKTASSTYEGDFKANVRHGKGLETLEGGIVFEGKWRDNRKVGEGVRRTRWGNSETTEIQQWKEGQLLNKDESVAPDLPFLQRH